MEPALRDLVRAALEEDRASEDITTLVTVPADARGRAVLIAKQECVFAGFDAFAAAFYVMDPSLEVATRYGDGWPATKGVALATVEGSLRSILSAERTALNFAQHLSGIATVTRRFKQAAARDVEIRDTRKTTPGLRFLEKRAVVAGGGTNHRMDLASAILIKDNHIAAAGSIERAVKEAKATGKHIEVECESLEQVETALAEGADELLLDNMPLDLLTRAVALAKGKAKTEASGNVTLDTVAAIAATGVDSISVGALTHSAPAADLSLEIEGTD